MSVNTMDATAMASSPKSGGSTSSRFQIEELASQDTSGVLFRAVDLQTGKPVAIRRFFPFGMSNGLDDEAQQAFSQVLERLMDLRHPALCPILAGGCDPGDGMPFMITEWPEGDDLGSFIGHHGFFAESAIILITQALEICDILSHALHEEMVWVDTSPRNIFVSKSESGLKFSFCISPLRCVKRNSGYSGLDSFVILTELVMGWAGRVISEQAGGGLGGWFMKVRNNPGMSLREAREALASSLGASPPVPASELLGKIMAPAPPPRHFKITPLHLAILAGLVLAGLVIGWLLTHHS